MCRDTKCGVTATYSLSCSRPPPPLSSPCWSVFPLSFFLSLFVSCFRSPLHVDWPTLQRSFPSLVFPFFLFPRFCPSPPRSSPEGATRVVKDGTIPFSFIVRVPRASKNIPLFLLLVRGEEDKEGRIEWPLSLSSPLSLFGARG